MANRRILVLLSYQVERLTVTEVAAKLKRHPNLIRRWLEEGRLRGEKFGEGRGGIWMISDREVQRFRRVAPPRRSRA